MNPDAEQELAATVAARRELGPEHDEHLVQGFLTRVQAEIDRRVDERVAARPSGRVPRHAGPSPGQLLFCIPILGVAGGIGKLPGLIAALVALVIVFALGQRAR